MFCLQLLSQYFMVCVRDLFTFFSIALAVQMKVAIIFHTKYNRAPRQYYCPPRQYNRTPHQYNHATRQYNCAPHQYILALHQYNHAPYQYNLALNSFLRRMG